MAAEKRLRSKNFSEHEKSLLKTIVSRHPVIEDKQHTSAVESKKRNAWKSICNEFNANEQTSTRTIQQLQVLWKNIKINLKKTAAEARRERFKTGGGPANKDTDQLDDLLTGIMENQQPLENIPDDDHLDSSDEGSHTHTTMGESQRDITEALQGNLPSTSSETRVAVSASTGHQNKRVTIHEKLAIEFHEHK
ncbi:myb/SANT-like DNA-binding domain-containing protein 3 [Sander lucioperca]|uniref:myb/SANT-like DNA-binding domain-containing protein 3 n=1 Tax=Sander lucioperca TaxID=283035 RepID=UPI00125D72C9|nr:myb/SANT-like DNA-binding domain-containing protein 3 [Sander lucioperca]